MSIQVLGIDISKSKFDCGLIRDADNINFRTKVLGNNTAGFQQLLTWLHKNIGTDLSALHVFMEATGVYHEALAEFLYENSIAVYVMNPADAANYSRYNSQHKTDKADCKSLAYAGLDCISNHRRKTHPWQPAPAHVKRLNALIAHLDTLEADRQRADNRMEKAEVSRAPDTVIHSIRDIQTHLQQQIDSIRAEIDQHIDQHPDLKKDRALLQTIPGVGEVVSLRMVALYHSKKFKAADQMAAFVGLIPRKQESGKHKGKTVMTKRGSARLRTKLYMAAVSAKTWNPDIRAHYRRLIAKNKPKIQAIGAAMRRLVHICFGVLKHQCKYQARVNVAA